MGLYGGGNTTVIQDNPYDDQWIRNWMDTANTQGNALNTRVNNINRRNIRQTNRISSIKDKNRQQGQNIRRNQNQITNFGNRLNNTTNRFNNRFTDLEQLVSQPTAIGDVTGLDNIISNLQSQYTTADRNINRLGNRMTNRLDALGSTLKGEFADKIEGLDLPGVRDSIAAAQGDLSSLTDDFSGLSRDMDWIQQLDLEGFDDRLSEQSTNLQNLITGQGTNLQNLITGQGADIRAEFGGDLTDLRNVLESGRGESLANLENEIGRDRAADLLQLRQDVETGTASEIEALAGNLRQEYGDQLFDLSDTFDQRFAGLQRDLGDNISSLFSQQGDLRGDLVGGLATLTSGLGTTSQQLEALRDSFGGYQQQSASNLGDIRSALEAEIGDLSGSLTSGLSGLQSRFTDQILGTDRAASAARDELRSSLSDQLSQQAVTSQQGLASEAAARDELRSSLSDQLSQQAVTSQQGLASESAARQEGLASEAAARESGLASESAARESGLAEAAAATASGLSEAAAARSELGTALRDEASSALQDVYQTREQALSNLSGQLGENLRAQEASLSQRIDQSNQAMEDRIGRLGSMMNYRMLGDSAGGVKMRRSKAYKSGAVSTGTGQLSRTMKLKTLNL